MFPHGLIMIGSHSSSKLILGIVIVWEKLHKLYRVKISGTRFIYCTACLFYFHFNKLQDVQTFCRGKTFENLIFSISDWTANVISNIYVPKSTTILYYILFFKEDCPMHEVNISALR